MTNIEKLVEIIKSLKQGWEISISTRDNGKICFVESMDRAQYFVAIVSSDHTLFWAVEPSIEYAAEKLLTRFKDAAKVISAI